MLAETGKWELFDFVYLAGHGVHITVAFSLSVLSDSNSAHAGVTVAQSRIANPTEMISFFMESPLFGGMRYRFASDT